MAHSEHFQTILRALQPAMHAHGVDVWLQPVADEFQGEYTAPYARRLEWLSGFSGSAGMAAISAHDSISHSLFVDGRYTLQAAQEAPESMRIIHSGDVSFAEWLAQQPKHLCGFDPWLHSAAQIKKWQKQANAQLKPLRPNLIDAVWKSQPTLPSEAVMVHPDALAGQSAAEKITNLRAAAKGQPVLLCLPDSIMWLLNIRGGDIPFNPLVLCYALVLPSAITLWMPARTLTPEIATHFTTLGVTVRDIKLLWNGHENAFSGLTQCMLDAASTPYGFYLQAEAVGCTIHETDDPVALPKACKNVVEQSGIVQAHQRDGVALCAFLHWFGQQNSCDELKASDALEAFRAQSPEYRGASFATIAGSGPHGAIVHYRASAASNRVMQQGELFLLDSGGQYPDGTTDVTRTIAVGMPSAEMIANFTRVLKGHITIASARFPQGVTGGQLDALARQYLWQVGLDYDHGTGHGVGAYLCVHEGPQRISKRAGDTVALHTGMIISNEPGYYKEGAYGIRIENLVRVVEVGKTEKGQALLGFETLTLAPIDRALIDVTMLTVDERAWLNAYHAKVLQVMELRGLQADALQWLRHATAPV